MMKSNKRWVGRFYPKKALEAAYQRILENGLTYADIAREHGILEQDIKDILSERRSGRRGKGHKAAVALGLKKSA